MPRINAPTVYATAARPARAKLFMNRSMRHLSVLLALLSLAGCNVSPSEPAELIIGNWRFLELDLPSSVRDRLESHERAQFAQVQIQLQMMHYSFFNDGTYSLDMKAGEDFSENMERGTYRLINDGTVLITEHTDERTQESNNSELKVLRLSADTLVVGDGNKNASMVFLRSK
jgi:hypothetical protein